jgi:hypothetical protein
MTRARHIPKESRMVSIPLAVSFAGALGIRRLAVLLSCAVLPLAMAAVAPTASAVEPTPGWQLHAVGFPTAFPASDGEDKYELILTNIGGAPSSGSPITVKGTLAPGLTLERVHGAPAELNEWECSEESGSLFTCTWPGVLNSFEQVDELVVHVGVAPGVAPDTVATSTFTVSGGGAATSQTSISTVLEPSAPTPFAVQDVLSFPANPDGVLDTQAGDHPNSLTQALDFTNAPVAAEENDNRPIENIKDIAVDLPVGLSGNPQAVPECPISALIRNNGSTGYHESNCPLASQVGTMDIAAHGRFIQNDNALFGAGEPIPVFNMVPERGYPAELGSSYAGLPLLMYASIVGSGASAHLRVILPGIPGTQGIFTEGAQLTLFGDPALHDGGVDSPGGFFTNPSACSGESLTTTVYGDSWQDPGAENPDGTLALSDPAWVRGSAITPANTGCDLLHFAPSLAVQPQSTQADVPTGVGIDVKVPQNPDPTGLATPDVKEVTVALPAGMAVSPPAADDLGACTDEQFDASSHEPASCPPDSQIGTVTASTPVLAAPLEGQLFLGSPECSPCSASDAQSGRMVRLLMQLEGPGLVLKFPGSASLDPATGRMTATFREIIQQPVSDVQVQLKGGPRAPLASPQTCGAATTTSSVVPWSTPETPTATSSSSFNVDWDGNGGACPGSLPFAPGFNGGTVTPLAGAFSAFTLTFSRRDREQDLSGISVKMPAGLLAVIKGIPLCGEPQAAQGACSSASQIGTTEVSVGPGSHPLWKEGQVFLTGPYGGGPFGLSVVVPAVAGPFDLGTVVVRASIQVDPSTAALSVVSDPFPTILDGVPLRLQTINVNIDRPGFVFNPTNCDEQQLAGTITSTLGASVPVADRFQASGCLDLPFRPSFTVSTQAKTSKQEGASLTVKTTFPSGPQANIRTVAVTLPEQLPARLTTIQQACPQGSDIGIGTATTPVLASTLTGPAYLVSHGGAAFPNVVIVFQAEGITLDLVGGIDIKHGVTSSTFATVPDAPISSFQLNLPQGPHSGLAAVVPAKTKGSLCGQSLSMPFTITGQNGAVLTQNVKIAVLGCSPTIEVLRHSVKGKIATIAVKVPSAGKLVATGMGLSRATGRASGSGTVTLTLTLTKSEQLFLSRHPGHRLKAAVKLRFTPTHGKSLSSLVTVLIS